MDEKAVPQVKIDILNVDGPVQVELLAEALDHLRGELGVHGIHLTGFSGGQVDDQKRNNGDEEEGDDLLNNAPSDKCQHQRWFLA